MYFKGSELICVWNKNFLFYHECSAYASLITIDNILSIEFEK